MAMQLGAAREAFLAAGAPAELAARAAEELAGYENRLATIDTRLAELALMVAGLYAVLIPAAWLLVRVAFKTGAIA